MPRRSGNFSEYVSMRLRKVSFARGYVLAGQEKGETMQESVVDLVRSYGIKEFAKDYGISRPMIYRFLQSDGHHYEAIEKIFKKLKLRMMAFDPLKGSKDMKKAA